MKSAKQYCLQLAFVWLFLFAFESQAQVSKTTTA